MNPRSLRRLAGDHAALHTAELPPNYLFDPNSDSSSDLTQLDILLAGPQSTPYELGLFNLHLSIPATYPVDPPKAFFRTKIFHPNIEPETGAVCVETLKRDWKDTLTLRDVLVTISCLLVYPNASSALNAEAGMLLEGGGGEGWEGFEKRAKLMTRLQAGVPKHLKDAAREAQTRGENKEEDLPKEAQRTRHVSGSKESGLEEASAADVRRERRTTRRRGVLDYQELPSSSGRRTRSTRTSQLAPTPAESDMPPPPRPFATHSATDDVFGDTRLPPPSQRNLETPPTRPTTTNDDDSVSEMQDADQENKTSLTPVLASKPTLHPSHVRNGPSIPLGELSLYDPTNDSDTDKANSNDSSAFLSDSMEAEYPPSPRKSPVKTQRRSSEEHYAEHPPSPRKKSPRKREQEYPPSPKKQSPVKGATAGRGLLFPPPTSSSSDIFGSSASLGPRPDFFRAESSRTGATRTGSLLFTPQMNNEMHPALFSTQETPDLASMTEGSEFEMSFEVLRQSEREKKNLLASPPRRKTRTKFRSRDISPERVVDDSEMALEDSIFVGGRQLRSGTVTPRLVEVTRPAKRQVTPPVVSAVTKSPAGARKRSPRVEKTPPSTSKSKTAEEKRREEMESKLWELCGGDVDRWNRGDFGRGAEFMNIRSSRW